MVRIPFLKLTIFSHDLLTFLKCFATTATTTKKGNTLKTIKKLSQNNIYLERRHLARNSIGMLTDTVNPLVLGAH